MVMQKCSRRQVHFTSKHFFPIPERLSSGEMGRRRRTMANRRTKSCAQRRGGEMPDAGRQEERRAFFAIARRKEPKGPEVVFPLRQRS